MSDPQPPPDAGDESEASPSQPSSRESLSVEDAMSREELLRLARAHARAADEQGDGDA